MVSGRIGPTLVEARLQHWLGEFGIPGEENLRQLIGLHDEKETCGLFDPVDRIDAPGHQLGDAWPRTLAQQLAMRGRHFAFGPIGKDLPRLEAFLSFVGVQARIVLEFRHESWFDGEVFDCLRTHACALCYADMDDSPSADLASTAGWGYVRLRREDYTDEDLRKWIERLRSQAWDETYVFFKHVDAGAGPKLAARFLELAGS